MPCMIRAESAGRIPRKPRPRRRARAGVAAAARLQASRASQVPKMNRVPTAEWMTFSPIAARASS
jgi:hypothetical protein